jgi:hypothetical protein
MMTPTQMEIATLSAREGKIARMISDKALRVVETSDYIPARGDIPGGSIHIYTIYGPRGGKNYVSFYYPHLGGRWIHT